MNYFSWKKYQFFVRKISKIVFINQRYFKSNYFPTIVVNDIPTFSFACSEQLVKVGFIWLMQKAFNIFL